MPSVEDMATFSLSMFNSIKAMKTTAFQDMVPYNPEECDRTSQRNLLPPPLLR